jgi:hypothetical protein
MPRTPITGDHPPPSSAALASTAARPPIRPSKHNTKGTIILGIDKVTAEGTKAVPVPPILGWALITAARVRARLLSAPM